MAGHGIVVAQQRETLQELRAIVEDLDPDAAQALTRFMPGGAIPNPDKYRAEYDLFVLELMLILARAARPRRRGRPRKDAA